MGTLVVGATGIVGGYIVEQLVRSGLRPLALSRSAQTDSNVDWVRGDLVELPRVQMPAVDTLYCTAEIGLLADVLEQGAMPHLRRVVAFTSTSIVTKIDSEILAERELLQRLAAGELALASICARRGIGWTVLRPTVIYAEGRDGNVSRLARLIRRFGFLPLMGDGKGLRQPVHAEDLAVGALAAVACDATIGKIYEVPGAEVISYREMVGRIFDALDRRRRIISAPPWLWRYAFWLAKPFFPHANVAMGNRMSKDMVFDGSMAQADFGWAPRAFHPHFPMEFR